MVRKWQADIKKITIFVLSLTMFLSVTYIYVSPVSANSGSTIYIDTDQIITQDYEGFGVQWDPSDLFDYTDKQWDSFYEKAGFLKPNILRVMLHDGDSYVIGFDENNNPIYDWNSVMMKRVYKILDFAEKNDVPVILGEWRSISERGLLSYNEIGKTVTWDNPIWQTMILDCLKHLIVDKGYTCIKYYNMVNEPNYYVRDNGGTDQASYNMWKKGITQLREKMDNSGVSRIKNIKIVGPDVYDKQEAWINQAKSDELKDIIELTEVHRYAPKSEVESGLIETKLKNWKAVAEELDPNVKKEGFGLGEMGISGTGPGDSQLNARNYDYGVDMFDYALQGTRAGLKFGSVWGFEDSMHVQHNDIVNTFKDKYGPVALTEEGKAYQVHTPTGDPNIDNDIKIWGFWNELGEEMAEQNAEAHVTGRANTVKASDEQLKPWYYAWSMFCRYMPSGMQILETTDSGIDQVRATSGMIIRGENKADLSMAVVNTSNKEQKITLTVPNANGKTTLNQFYYFNGDRPMNSKGQLEVYDTLKDIDLSKGLEVTMPANTCMIFTTLGYNQESHPMTLTTGQKAAVTGVKIQEESSLEKVTVGKTYQMVTHFTPSISSAQMEWKVTDYFGKETDIAIIDDNGKLTANKAGQFKIVGYVKDHPEIKDTKSFIATTTDTLIDDLIHLNVGTYENLVRDDNSANFNNAKTIKRSDSNANGQSGIITYEADGIFDFEFKAYTLNSNLPTSGNFTIEVSQDGQQWEAVECQFKQEAKFASGWYPYIVTPKFIDATKNYQYLRVILKSKNYKTYDPQYGGGSISYGPPTASEIQLNNQERYVVIGETIEFKAAVFPSNYSQDVTYRVVEPNGDSTTKAIINENGILTGKELGNVIVVVETEDHSLATYYPIQVIGGHFIDEINNFDLMYDHGSFTFESDESKFGEKTLIKRTSDTPQSIVYAYNGIEKVAFEAFSNGTFNEDQTSIYMSKDGIHYDLIEASITKIGSAPGSSDFTKYRIEASVNTDEYNFVKIEVKNDSKIYNPMIARAEIIYNGVNMEATNINVVENILTTHVNETIKMEVKTAPFNAIATLTYESMNPNVAVVDENGMITGVSTGSTYIKVSLNKKEYINVPINVLEENLALKKDVQATSEYNQTDRKASLAVDGDYSTRWGSTYKISGSDSITVDLGKTQTIDTIKIFWEAARAKDYNVEVAGEDKKFEIIKEMRDITGVNNDSIHIDPIEARYIKINGITPVGRYGYSIYELEVYNNSKIINVETIQFDNESLELYNGQTTELNVKINPENVTYPLATFTSSDENIVIIKNGKMIAVNPGKVSITAEVDGKIAVMDVTVVKENSQMIADELTSLYIQNGKVQLPKYEDYQLSIYSSDHEKIIDLDGNVYIPVNNTSVKIVIEVVDQSGKKAYTQPVLINIEGQKEELLSIQDFINELHNINELLYKPHSIEELKNVLNDVENILNTDDLLVSDVEDQQRKLNEVYEKLELKEDKTALNQVLEEIKSIDSQLYTEQSYQILQAAIEEAKVVLNNPEATKDDINKAIENINQAKNELVEIQRTSLEKLLSQVKAVDQTKYTAASLKELETAIKNAEAALKTTDQKKIDEAYVALKKAYEGLEEKEESTTKPEEPGESQGGTTKPDDPNQDKPDSNKPGTSTKPEVTTGDKTPVQSEVTTGDKTPNKPEEITVEEVTEKDEEKTVTAVEKEESGKQVKTSDEAPIMLLTLGLIASGMSYAIIRKRKEI